MEELKEGGLFVEPNAYIMRANNSKGRKKVVFQEPYENIPIHYINNNFQKRECSFCEKGEGKGSSSGSTSTGFPFDIKNLLSLFAGVNSGADFGSLMSMFSAGSGDKSSQQNFDLNNILSLLCGKGEGRVGLANILNLFKKSEKIEKKQNISSKTSKNDEILKKNNKNEEISIKRYTRVE